MGHLITTAEQLAEAIVSDPERVAACLGRINRFGGQVPNCTVLRHSLHLFERVDQVVAVLDLGSAGDEQAGRTVKKVGGGHAAVGGGGRAEGRAVSAVLGITSVGLDGNASASAGRGILNQSAVAEGVGVQRGVFAELLGGLRQMREQFRGQQNIGEDDFGPVLHERGFDRGERQIALVTAGRRGAFG